MVDKKDLEVACRACIGLISKAPRNWMGIARCCICNEKLYLTTQDCRDMIRMPTAVGGSYEGGIVWAHLSTHTEDEIRALVVKELLRG